MATNDDIFFEDEDEMINCKICKCRIKKSTHRKAHIESNKHQKNLREAKQNNPYDCGSCHNTGHHKGELGNYCFNCVWGEILMKEAKRLFIENHKNIFKYMIPNCQYTDDMEDCKSKCMEHLNHLKI